MLVYHAMKIDYDLLCYINKEEFLTIKDEIFNKEIYKFQAKEEDPFIIDLGAHIGLATIYFKSLYPNAKIIAVEPNPESFRLLKKNIETVGFNDVEMINAAVGSKKGVRDFYIDSTEKHWNSTAGFYPGTWKGTYQSEKIEVEVVTLSQIISEPVSLLKVDIEGAELKVLEEAAEKLSLVKKIFVESHPLTLTRHKKLSKFLKSHRFSLKFWKDNYEVDQIIADQLLIIEADRTD